MPRRKQEPQKYETKRAKEDITDDDATNDDVMNNDHDSVTNNDAVNNNDNKPHKNGKLESGDVFNKKKIKLVLPETYGELLITGGTNWSVNGRKQAKKGDEKYENIGRNLFKPHRYKAMAGVKVCKVISGCCANHCLLLTNEGRVYSWGRNECGQLGHGDRDRYDVPKPIESLQAYTIVGGSCGRNHTLCLTDDGNVFAFGDNTLGQLGLGNQSTNVPSPTRIQYHGDPIVEVACGGNFSVVLDCEGNVHTFGCPEYGQLGNNTDGKYIAKANKVSFNNVKSPFRIPLFIEKMKGGQIVPMSDVTIKSIACGANHVVALDSKKRVFSWGFGGYGRLGHSEQKDEHTPRMIQLFERQGRGAVQVFAGSSCSMAVNEMGSTLFWGLQGSITSRDTTMYPKPLSDLQGWKVRSISCGGRHTVVAADDSVIVWGTGTSSGELGLGESRKSSANPDLMKTLSNVYIHSVSCGQVFTLMIARTTEEGDGPALDQLPQIDPVMCP